MKQSGSAPAGAAARRLVTPRCSVVSSTRRMAGDLPRAIVLDGFGKSMRSFAFAPPLLAECKFQAIRDRIRIGVAAQMQSAGPLGRTRSSAVPCPQSPASRRHCWAGMKFRRMPAPAIRAGSKRRIEQRSVSGATRRRVPTWTRVQSSNDRRTSIRNPTSLTVGGTDGRTASQRGFASRVLSVGNARISAVRLSAGLGGSGFRM